MRVAQGRLQGHAGRSWGLLLARRGIILCYVRECVLMIPACERARLYAFLHVLTTRIIYTRLPLLYILCAVVILPRYAA